MSRDSGGSLQGATVKKIVNNTKNLPMQYTKIFFSTVKIEKKKKKKKKKKKYMFAQNIDCGFTAVRTASPSWSAHWLTVQV